MKPETPLVSVLIRSTGRPELTQALESISQQHYQTIEVLIVDAGGGVRPLDQYIPEDFPFSLEIIDSDTPLQRCVAANLLLENATGQYGIFLDDDDWFLPEHIEKLVTAQLAHPESWIYSGIRCVENNGQEVRIFDEPFNPTRLLIENYIPIHAVLFDCKKIRQKNILFDPAFDLFEDWDFWLQCLSVQHFIHVPGVSAVYRIHGQSGAGVKIDRAEQAEQALQQIIAKWRQRWTVQQLQDLFGYARHVVSLQNELVKQNDYLEQQRLGYENSKSWRLTKPLRHIADILRQYPAQQNLKKARTYLARSVLDIATAIYRNPAFSRLIAWIPANVKRQVRNTLMVYSQTDTPPVNTGLRVYRPLGKQPLVSIIIPVYNHANYIEKCIRSALAQDWENLEVVVVNDASPDPEVGRILQRLEGEPRLQIHHLSENVGICRAQNEALMRTQGDIIAFLDCDDYLPANAISCCIQAWRDDTVYLHTGRVNVDENNQEINRIHFMSLPRQDYFAENLRAMYATHLKLIRRDAFSRVGLFDPRFDSAQDYEMLMRIAFHYPSSSFVHVPDFLYFHRLHGQQTTQTQKRKQDRLTQLIQNEACLRENIRHGKFEHFISFIMLSYGKHTQTLKAIQGLTETVTIPHEIILYDNGSTAETVDFIREYIDGKFPQLKVHYGDRNLGPAQGRRQALEYASGDWFIIFDNDEIPEPGWLEELLLRAHAYDDVGAVCCRVVFPDGKLQFSGGRVLSHQNQRDVIDLALFDRGESFEALPSCQFRQVDWCPIGATLFTLNIKEYLHDGYPNTFEDAGVSFALKKRGLRLLNAPGALVWHDHITFQPKAEMKEQYLRDRYHPKMMLKSVASFYHENGLLIYDEYIWRENGLHAFSRPQIEQKLQEVAQLKTDFTQ